MSSDLIKIVLHKTIIKLDKSKKTKPLKISKKESQELDNLDNELKALIKKNESLKMSISKIFKGMENKNNTNNNPK